MLVKTGIDGKLLKKIPVANHHGDPCLQDGKLYVAVNLGKFNDPQGNADSWVYVYNAGDLSFEARHPVQEVFHGAGGIGFQDGRFFVVGGLPMGIEENYVYEYDPGFRFIKKHVVKSGHTLLGIQTATFCGSAAGGSAAMARRKCCSSPTPSSACWADTSSIARWGSLAFRMAAFSWLEGRLRKGQGLHRQRQAGGSRREVRAAVRCGRMRRRDRGVAIVESVEQDRQTRIP